MPFKVGEIATGLTNSFKLPLTVGKKTATVNGSPASIASEVPGSVTLVDTPVYGSDVVINVEDFNLDFTSGVLDPRITFSRTANATQIGSNGQLQYAPHNIFPYSEEFDNSTWLKANSTIGTNATTAPDGSLTADLFTGTGTGSNYLYRGYTVTAGIPFYISCYVKNFNLPAPALVLLRDFTEAGAAYFSLATGTVSSTTGIVSNATIVSLDNGWFRISAQFTPTVSGTHNLSPVHIANSNQTTGFYAWGAQLNVGNLQPYYKTVDAAYYGPRFDYDPITLEPKGLLIEEQRTNTIRNNTMQGAVVGTPGTLPTNWQKSEGSSLSFAVVGTGTEDGISYIDIRFSGTSSGTTGSSIQFEQNSQIVAAVGQTWTLTSYAKIIGGSMAGISIIRIGWEERSTAFLASNFSTAPLQTGGKLAIGRITHVGTNGNASTTSIKPYIFFSPTNGAAIDITLRIGLPQLELGAFATSVIPTAGAAATRTADLASVTGTNFSSWYNQTEGTFMFDYNALGPRGTSGFVAAVVDSADSVNNYLGFSYIGSSTNAGSTYWRNGGAGAISAPPYLAYGGYRKFAPTYDNTRNLVVAVDGAIASSLTSTTSPPAVNRLNIGRREDNSFTASLWLRRLVYYPTRLSNDELQSLTADRPIVTYTPV